MNELIFLSYINEHEWLCWIFHHIKDNKEFSLVYPLETSQTGGERNKRVILKWCVSHVHVVDVWFSFSSGVQVWCDVTYRHNYMQIIMQHHMIQTRDEFILCWFITMCILTTPRDEDDYIPFGPLSSWYQDGKSSLNKLGWDMQT